MAGLLIWDALLLTQPMISKSGVAVCLHGGVITCFHIAWEVSCTSLW